MSFCWQSTSKIFNTTPPGNPKTVLTPSRLSDSQNISAPVFFISIPLPLSTVLTVSSQNLHDFIFTRQFHLLQPLFLNLLVGRKVEFMLKLIEFFLQLLMLFIILPEFGITIQKRSNRHLFTILHKRASF